jgi:hypothetical protein
MEIKGQPHAPAALPPGTHWRGGWEGHGAGLDAVAKRKTTRPCGEPNPVLPALTELTRTPFNTLSLVLHILHHFRICSELSLNFLTSNYFHYYWRSYLSRQKWSSTRCAVSLLWLRKCRVLKSIDSFLRRYKTIIWSPPSVRTVSEFLGRSQVYSSWPQNWCFVHRWHWRKYLPCWVLLPVITTSSWRNSLGNDRTFSQQPRHSSNDLHLFVPLNEAVGGQKF